MSEFQIKRVVIVGGGTAGWVSAAALAKLLAHTVDITLIESDDIGTVGVGEATIPQIRRLNGVLGLDEAEFLRETKATIKLGIEFNNWGGPGETYIHTFGDVGINLAGLPFHQYWLRAQQEKHTSLWDYSLHYAAAYAHKFAPMERVGNTAMGGLSYAYHFDAGLYAQYLRRYAQAAGVKRIEGMVNHVALNESNGHIKSVTLAAGETVEGDLFIDCSGFRGLLIGQALGVDYIDWSHWLPCNRAIAVPSEKTAPLLPYTKSTAHEAGWQWRIPLQHRTGNGHVFCDKFMSEDEATAILLNNLDGEKLAEPRPLRFTTGHRQKFWTKNCVAIGLSSGFLEPLESTSIHLIQSNISRLIELFPDQSFVEADIAEYNRLVSKEFELIRDFLILHYAQTKRDDTPFWKYCAHMEIPETLQQKLELFAASGKLYREPDDLFRESSWIQVMVGQGIMPKRYHIMADRLSEAELHEFLANVQKIRDQAVANLPLHQTFIDKVCGDALQ